MLVASLYVGQAMACSLKLGANHVELCGGRAASTVGVGIGVVRPSKTLGHLVAGLEFLEQAVLALYLVLEALFLGGPVVLLLAEDGGPRGLDVLDLVVAALLELLARGALLVPLLVRMVKLGGQGSDLLLQALVIGRERGHDLFGGHERVDRGIEQRVRVGGVGQWRVELEEGGLDGLGLVRDEIDEVLVGWWGGLAMAGGKVVGRTLEQGLDVVELAGIVELAKVLGLLGEVLALCERVALVGDQVGGDGVELGDERGEVDGPPRANGLLELVFGRVVCLSAVMMRLVGAREQARADGLVHCRRRGVVDGAPCSRHASTEGGV